MFYASPYGCHINGSISVSLTGNWKLEAERQDREGLIQNGGKCEKIVVFEK